MDCFESEVFWGADSEVVDMNTIKKAKNFGQKDWQETNVIGVQFANGVSALVAYNKDAKQDPYSNQIVNISGGSDGKKGSVELGTTALAILYDTNGFKSPNKSAKDLRSINVTKLGSGCFAEANGVCLAMQPQRPTAHKWNACQSDGTSTDPEDQKFMSDYGIQYCFNGDDYWAGAVKLCGHVNKLPTLTNLITIAKYIYDTDNITTYTTSDLTFNSNKASMLGITPGATIWSGEKENQYSPPSRTFESVSTSYSNANRGYSINRLVICIDN